jgi:hypothetical protein
MPVVTVVGGKLIAFLAPIAAGVTVVVVGVLLTRIVHFVRGSCLIRAFVVTAVKFGAGVPIVLPRITERLDEIY